MEAYGVDEMIHLDQAHAEQTISPAILKAMDIGALCNNASITRNEDGVFVGQSTDVALLNVLDVMGVPDRRSVSSPLLLPVFPAQLMILSRNGSDVHAPL